MVRTPAQQRQFELKVKPSPGHSSLGKTRSSVENVTDWLKNEHSTGSRL